MVNWKEESFEAGDIVLCDERLYAVVLEDWRFPEEIPFSERTSADETVLVCGCRDFGYGHIARWHNTRIEKVC
jgi:hypothetical protein